MSSIIKTPFKLSLDEILCSASATLCLQGLKQNECSVQSIAEVCLTPQYGFTAAASLIESGPRFVRITDIKEGFIDWSSVPFCDCPEPENYELHSGDILIARSGSVGKSFLLSDIPERAIFASYMIRLRAKLEFDPRYIYWCLQSQQFWQQIMNAQRGSAMKNINGQMILSLKFPIPSRQVQEVISLYLEGFRKYLKGATSNFPVIPFFLQKQQRAISRIEELATKIEEVREVRREAAEETESLLESSIDSVFHTMNGAETKSLKAVTSKIGSGSTPAGGRNSYPSSGIPFIRSLNVRMRQFTREGLAFIDEATHENMRGTQVRPNDVLLNITGASIGRVACVPSDIVEGNVSQHVAIIRPIESLNSRYLLYWLSQPSIQESINSEQKGATRQGFTKVQIEAFKVPLPSLAEQQRIVTYLDSLQAKVDILKREQAKISSELNALLPSILDKAFKGEL